MTSDAPPDDVIIDALNDTTTSSNVTDDVIVLGGGGDYHDRLDRILFHYVVPALFGLMSVFGALGNSLVIYVILKKDRMRTVTNLLLLNLAAADLSFALVIPPCTAYTFASSGWPFGDTECRLMHYLVNVTAYVTVYTLVLISAIRYMTIVHNARTARVRTRRNVVVVIVMIWIIMMIVNVPIFFSYGRQLVEDDMIICENYSKEIGQRIFATFFVNAYILPLCVIAVFSIGIVHHIARQKPTSLTSGVKAKSASKKRQVGRMLVQVVVVFALLWLPIHVHLLLEFFADIPPSRVYESISWVWNLLAYFNSCVNPIIYNRTSKDFKDAFREVAGCGAGQAQQLQQQPNHEANQSHVVRLLRHSIVVRGREEKNLPAMRRKSSSAASADAKAAAAAAAAVAKANNTSSEKKTNIHSTTVECTAVVLL